MKTPLFFKRGLLVKILTGNHAGLIGTISEIVLTPEFHPLIMVKTLCTESGHFLTCPYLRGELELLPSNSEAVLAYIRMSMPEPLRAVA